MYEDMEFYLKKFGKLEFLNKEEGKIKVQIEHKKRLSIIELMKLGSAGILASAEFGQNKVSFALSADKKYMVFTENQKGK